jgi:hypothetical protein
MLPFIRNYTKRSFAGVAGTIPYRFYLYNVSASQRSLFYQSKNYAFSATQKCFRPIVVLHPCKAGRAFSTSKSVYSSSTDSSGLVVFSDADKDKLNILKYVKGKSGIYM